MTRARFAPSPTGDLHLGGAWVALASYVLAKRDGGAFVVRDEDLDTPRVVPGARHRILEDLAWLGFAWDEGPDRGGPHAPYAQSERTMKYTDALTELQRCGLVYPCDCSRAEIDLVASAPHEGEERVYPGLCREKDPSRRMKRPAAMRLRVAPGTRITFTDGVLGDVTQDVHKDVGDFVLRRGDGVFAYQFAVVFDDATMAIDDVVRGVDLAPSTGRQILLARLLGLPAPRYHHVPLVIDEQGARIAKRAPFATIRELRRKGVEADTILGVLAEGLGLASTDAPVTPSELAEANRGRAIPWRTTSFTPPHVFELSVVSSPRT
ncbi:MAG: tRNA glutamyl-Q(34) synthetase GluQRS [Polyangiaceae bacterium]